MIKAFIDMDTVAYRCAASCEPTKTKEFREPLETAIQRADELMFRILADCETDLYTGWIGGGENYRKLLYPLYKANRDTVRRPEFLQPVREFLVSEWGAKVAVGYEADDAIGIAYDGEGVICSVDKDLRQIPGRHYNFINYQWDTVTDVQAELNFWCSMLIGDRADNIPGIPGIGAVKAPRILGAVPRGDLKAKVFELYEQFDMDFHLNYHLLYILRNEEDWFNVENLIRQSKRTESAKGSSPVNPGSLPEPIST